MLESELAAAAAGGVTSLVCPPDTDPRARRARPGGDAQVPRPQAAAAAALFPLGALTRGLKGEALTEMAELTEAGCVGFSQADVPVADTLVLLRALQYAATFGYTVWLRPQDAWLGKGVAASGAVATRLGLSGVPVAAETIALHTIFELVRATGARVHLCRLSQRRRRGAAARGQGRGPAGDGRREHQLAAPDRRRHRLLQRRHAPDAAAAPAAPTATRCAPALADGTHRRAGVRPQPGRRRREEPALRRGRARRHRAGTAAEPGAEVGRTTAACRWRRRWRASPASRCACWATRWARWPPAPAAWSRAAWPTSACSTPARAGGARPARCAARASTRRSPSRPPAWPARPRARHAGGRHRGLRSRAR